LRPKVCRGERERERERRGVPPGAMMAYAANIRN
jgi:hypothetical protein